MKLIWLVQTNDESISLRSSKTFCLRQNEIEQRDSSLKQTSAATWFPCGAAGRYFRILEDSPQELFFRQLRQTEAHASIPGQANVLSTCLIPARSLIAVTRVEKSALMLRHRRIFICSRKDFYPKEVTALKTLPSLCNARLSSC
jgi:hypothetical protein